MFGMDNRSSFLGMSLLVEASLSKFLSGLLDISDSNNSLSFGNKSSALSFRAKVNLLLDMKVFDKNDNWKLEKFMEIRNQFMHNLDASTYEKCFGFLSGAQEKLLKEYPQDKNLPIEDQLRIASQKLASETLDIVQKVFSAAIGRKVIEGNQTALSTIAKASKEVMDILYQKAKTSNDPDKISITEYWNLMETKYKEHENDPPPTVTVSFSR
jgi:hypothetical protein